MGWGWMVVRAGSEVVGYGRCLGVGAPGAITSRGWVPDSQKHLKWIQDTAQKDKTHVKNISGLWTYHTPSSPKTTQKHCNKTYHVKAQIYFYIIIVQLSQATNPETKKKKKKKASPLVIAHAQCSETHIWTPTFFDQQFWQGNPSWCSYCQRRCLTAAVCHWLRGAA